MDTAERLFREWLSEKIKLGEIAIADVRGQAELLFEAFRVGHYQGRQGIEPRSTDEDER